MVIIVKDNKNPVMSKAVRIYQQENLVDRMVIYIVDTYNGYDISEFSAHIEYIDPGNQLKTEVLTVADEQDKDGYVKYTLPITTELTKLAGTTKLYFSFTRVDEETMETQVFHTGSMDLEILKWEGAVLYTPPEALSAIDEKLAEVQAEIAKTRLMQEDYLTAQPNNLGVDSRDRLHLLHDDTVIGAGVEIVVPTIIDHEIDDENDGITDVDDVTSSTVVPDDSEYQYVDLNGYTTTSTGGTLQFVEL